MGRKSSTGKTYYNLKDGVYIVRVRNGRFYKDGTPAHTTRRVHTKTEADQMILKLMAQAELGPASFDGDKLTFNEVLAQYLKFSPPKPECVLRPLREYFGHRKIKTINYSLALSYRREREKQPNGKYKDKSKAPLRSVTTVNREMEVLKTVMLFALANGWISRHPFQRVRGQPPLIDKKAEKRRTRFPTPAEEAALLEVCVPPRAHLLGLVIASLDTGLRRGALQELTWNCVDFQTGLIRVPEGNRFKERPEYTGMTERLETELLRLYEESDKKPDSRIFGKREFKGAWETACKLAEIEGLRFNDLRHGFSTGLMEAGIPKHLAMKAAGHKNPDIHDIYANIDQRIARQVADALDKLHQSRSIEQEYVN